METLAALASCGAGLAFLRWRSRPQGPQRSHEPRMRRLVLKEANPDISKAKMEVEEVDVPHPKQGQVLIRVAASPVNPSDDGAWRSAPGEGYPMALGTEGSGTVIATGGGLLPSYYMGRNVIFFGKAYAQYALADAVMLTSVPQHVPVEDACAAYINPLTVISIVEAVRARGGKAFIHTAAASQLGQMLVKYCKQEGIVLVNLVRRKEQVQILEGLGAEHVVDTSAEAWEQRLAELIRTLQISHAFDCIAGDMPGKLFSLLPPGGTVFVYGRLSGKLEQIDPIDFIYRRKRLEGFLLTTWLFGDGYMRGLCRWWRQTRQVQQALDSTFATQFKDTSLPEMLSLYCTHKSAGATGAKIRVRP